MNASGAFWQDKPFRRAQRAWSGAGFLYPFICRAAAGQCACHGAPTRPGGTLENVAAMANHASTRTTQLYDRRRDEISLDEVERIRG